MIEAAFVTVVDDSGQLVAAWLMPGVNAAQDDRFWSDYMTLWSGGALELVGTTDGLLFGVDARGAEALSSDTVSLADALRG